MESPIHFNFFSPAGSVSCIVQASAAENSTRPALLGRLLEQKRLRTIGISIVAISRGAFRLKPVFTQLDYDRRTQEDSNNVVPTNMLLFPEGSRSTFCCWTRLEAYATAAKLE